MTKTATTKTATEAIQAAATAFKVNGDDYRQCFWDRIANLEHERNREPAAIDDLICYSSAIDSEAEESAVSVALVAIIGEMGENDRAELHDLIADRLKWNDPMPCPRYRLWTLAEKLSR